MGTEIKTWQIVDGELQPVSKDFKDDGIERELEAWIESNPGILGPDIVVVGRQVPSKSGPIDLLGIDRAGNVVIVELKRDKIHRDALAQAIDYASDVSEWDVEKISDICLEYSRRSLEETLTEAFELDIENVNINNTQRILLVGFSIESALERMIEWLSDNFNVNINAIALSYVKTAGGEQLLTKTSIISEELEQERVKRRKGFQVEMDSTRGEHEPDALRNLLREYLARERVTSERIRDVLLPALLTRGTPLSRNELVEKLREHDPTLGAKAGRCLTTVSVQLGLKKNDFLRQVIDYETSSAREKDNFSLREEYKALVQDVLNHVGKANGPKNQ